MRREHSSPGASRIFLASRSPRRRALMRQMGLRFRVILSNADESHPVRDPRKFAISVAERKAVSASPKVAAGIIIGVDTIVVLGQRILGKPGSKADARRMLQALSGRTHRVISGICLLRQPDGKRLCSAETTLVKFRKISVREVESYVLTSEPYDKAGAYAIQGRAGFFVEWIVGDYFNVVGLPVVLLSRMLKRLDPDS